MTVRELIAKLQEIDPEAVAYIVVTAQSESRYEEIVTIRTIPRWANDHGFVWWGDSAPKGYERDGDVVILL